MPGLETVTMKEVAQCAGVSKATVSAVLSGTRSNMRISEATRQQVLETARKMHYRPNAVARSLRRKRTNIIGLYCGYGYLDTTLPFFAEVVGGLQKGCEEYQKDLLLHGTFRGHSVEAIYAELADGRIDGLVVYAPPQDLLIEPLASSHLPVIAVVEANPALSSVVVDDPAGSRLMAEYLVGQGHCHFFYWNACREMPSAARRHAAFCEAITAQGLEATEWYEEGQINPADALLTAWQATPRDVRPTVAVCWNDGTAYRLLEQCQLRGIQVPGDLAVTGYDGVPTPYGTARRLTTIRNPWPEMARTAISLLMAQLEGKEVPQETRLPVTLVSGDTA